jgi:hypothetical protein
MQLILDGVRNAQYADATNTRINCEIRWADSNEWLPFTADSTDPELHGRQIHAALVDGQFGAIAAYAPPPLTSIKEAKKVQINAWRKQAIDAGVAFNGVMFDSDDISRANLTGVVAAANAGIPLPEGFTWRSADNQDIPMDLAALVGLAGTMLAHVNFQYAKSWTLKGVVDAAADAAAVDAVTW